MRLRPWRDSLLFGPIVLFVLPVAGMGQGAPTLVGTLMDAARDQPVVTAQVELLDDRQRRVRATESDSLGGFTFERIRAGTYRLRARSIGYAEVNTPPFDVGASDSGTPVEVIVWMAVDAMPLAPLEVVARARPPVRHIGMSAFFERAGRRMGGNFIMREEIEDRGPRQVSDLLITAGVTVVSNMLEMPRLRCVPTIYIDGIRVFHASRPSGPDAAKHAFDAVNLISPFDVEGIEVFPGPASVPAEFGGPMSACGVISIWSRRWD